MSERTCSFDGCEKPVKRNQLCWGHHAQRRKGKPLAPLGKPRGRVGSGRPPKLCEIEGCDRKSRSFGLCKMHRHRQRVGIPMDKPMRAPDGSGCIRNGYLQYYMPGHPLAHKSGAVPAHRLVLLGRIGPGAHPCNWCGKTVSWDLVWPASHSALVADHVDRNKLNNDPMNVVPSCGECNKHRP